MSNVKKIEINSSGTQRVPAAAIKRATNDLLYIYNNNSMFINQKGYLQKLVELLFELGYYDNNKELFS